MIYLCIFNGAVPLIVAVVSTEWTHQPRIVVFVADAVPFMPSSDRPMRSHLMLIDVADGVAIALDFE